MADFFTFQREINGELKTFDVEAETREEAERKFNDPSNWTRASDTVASQQAAFLRDAETIEAPQGGILYRKPSGDSGYVGESFSTTDPATVERIVQGEPLESIFREQFQESAIQRNPMLSRAASYARGLPFVGEYVDEMAGKVYGPQAEAGARTLQTAMEERRPVESAVGQIATGIATTAPLGTIAPATRATKLGKGIERGIQGGAFGGVEGAVSGYGRGTTPEERAQEAQTGALFGAGLGAPLGAVGGVVEGAIESAKRVDLKQLAQELGISDDAATVILRMRDDGSTIEQINERLSRMGETARLVNMGPASKTLLDTIGSSSPESAAMVSQGVREAGREVKTKFESELDDLLGAPADGPKQIFVEVAEASAPARQQAYDAAYNTVIDYESKQGRNILGVLRRVPDRIMESAMKNANEMMQIEGLSAPQFRIVMKDGKLVPVEAPSIIQLDFLKKALGDMIQDGIDPVTGKISPESRRLMRLESDLRESVIGASPEYGKALGLGLDSIMESEGVGLISRFNTTKFEDWKNYFDRVRGIAGRTRKPPEAVQQAREYLLRMLRTNIDQSINDARATIQRLAAGEDVADQASAAMKVLKDYTTGNAQKKLRLFMSGAELREFNHKLEMIAEQLSLESAVARGSQTALRQSSQEVIKDLVRPGVFESLTEGEVGAAGKTLIRQTLGEINPDQRSHQQLLNEVGQALMQRRGDAEARRLAGIIRKIRDGQEVTQAEAQAVAQVIQAFGRSAIYETGEQQLIRR